MPCIVIIEDEKRAAELLEKMIFDIYATEITCIKCHELISGVDAIKKHKPFIVFLDVELPEYSGLQLFEILDNQDLSFNLIFTTASGKYALNAFEMSAIDYLLKPIQEDKLKLAIQKSLKNQTTKLKQIETFENNKISNKKRIVVPISNGYEVVSIDDIMYIKAEGSYAKLYLSASNFLFVSKNLKYFEDLLCDNSLFSRVHRSYIVNITIVKRIIKNDGAILLLTDGSQIPIIPEKLQEIIHKIKEN